MVHVPVDTYRDLYLDLLHLPVPVESLHLDSYHLLHSILFWQPPNHHRRLVCAHREDAGAGLAAGQCTRLGVEAGAAGAHSPPRLRQTRRPQAVQTRYPTSGAGGGLGPRLRCVAMFVLCVSEKLSVVRDHWGGGHHGGLSRQLRQLGGSCRLEGCSCWGVRQLGRGLNISHGSYLFSHRLGLLECISLRFPSIYK